MHEWKHLKEILEGTASLDRLIGGYTEQVVRDFFEEEARTYKEHCSFMKEVGIPNAHPAYVVLARDGERAFREGLANIMSQEPELRNSAQVLFDQARR